MEANTNLPGIGDRLANRYRIMFGRGAGPSGAVFKALDLENDLSVALKVINATFFDGPFASMNIARLSRAPEVEDPNVVKVYDFVASEGRHFVTSQLVEGLSLRAVLDLHDEGGEHFPVPKLKSFGERMLNGVRAFHRKGLVHGNIKPENFFVLPDRLALSDPWHLVDRRLREGEHIPVSDYYRAPEQLTDPTIEIPQSDLYAVGLILGELIAISPVKPGLALSTQVPRLTKRFDEMFTTATALDPKDRFDSVDAFATCMREAFSNVQKEGLWVRRMHETGSFRAIRLPGAAGPEVTPIPEMPVESILPETEATKVGPGDLMDIPDEPPVTVEPDDDFGFDELIDDEVQSEPTPGPAPMPLPEPPEPVLPEADEEGVVTFESMGNRSGLPITTDNRKSRDSQKGRKGRRAAAAAPAPAPAAQPVRPAPRAVTQPQHRVETPPAMPAQSFRAAPIVKTHQKKPSGILLLLGVVIVVLIAVIGFMIVRSNDSKQPEVAGQQTVAAAAPAQGQAPAAAPAQAQAPAPAPAPAPEPAQAPVQAQAPAPAAAPAQAPAPTPAPEPEPKPEPAKAPTLASMLTCAQGSVLVVTDSKSLSGSGKKPGDVAYCIDKQEYAEGGKTRGGMTLSSAKAACRKVGKSVCSARQWQTACENQASNGVVSITGGYAEWTSDGRIRGGDSSTENANCSSSDKRFSPKSTDGTRCCDDPEYKL